LAGDRRLFLPEVAVAAVPIPPAGPGLPAATVVYGVRTTGGTLTLEGSIWKYLGAVLAIAGAGMAMGLCLLRYSLLEPLKRLVKSGRGTVQAGLPAGSAGLLAMPGEGDEIGALARLLQEVNGGLDEWRERVASLEASMDRRVQDETHDVKLKLRQVERKAWLDPLTRLGNRRLLEEKFAAVFAHAREAGEELAVVMIDVDHFKTLNDTLGHKAGDELIGFIGELLQQCVREADLAIRYGGDEFVLVFPGATGAMAATAAERIVRLFGQRARLLPVEPKPSMSVGVACLREHRAATAGGLLQMADEALYRAKGLGKSQVCVYRPGRAPRRVASAQWR